MAEPTLGKRIISFGTDFGKSFTDMEKFKTSMSVVGKTVEDTYKHFIKFEHGLLGLASPLGKTVIRFSELGIAAGLLSIAFGKLPIVGPTVERTLKLISIAMIGVTAAVTLGVAAIGQLVESIG